MYDLKQIQTRAMKLYPAFFPPDNLKEAMREAGVPEEQMWEVREAIRKLEEPLPQGPKPKRKKKKVAPVSSGPPEIHWEGRITMRGHEVNLAELNRRDKKLAAAHDDTD